MTHQPECTWQHYLDEGEKPPGQSFWGRLNYVWCQKFCVAKSSDTRTVDVTDMLREMQAPDGSLKIG